MTMSPHAFRQSFQQLLADLTRCYELCTAVRQNRRIGTKHDALDTLQDDLAATIASLQIEYDTLRRNVGSRMDLGDEAARKGLHRAARNVSNELRTRLEDLAYKRESSDGASTSTSHRGHSRPGFGDLTRKLHRIEASIEDTLSALAQRLEPSTSSPSAETYIPTTTTTYTARPIKRHTVTFNPTPLESEPVRHPEIDETVISLDEVDRMREHMKHSWEERAVNGQLVYVNAWDPARIRTERPEGFVKGLRSARSWERLSPTAQSPRQTDGDAWSTMAQRARR